MNLPVQMNYIQVVEAGEPEVLRLAEAAAAHRLMESSTHIGKIMLQVAG